MLLYSTGEEGGGLRAAGSTTDLLMKSLRVRKATLYVIILHEYSMSVRYGY